MAAVHYTFTHKQYIKRYKTNNTYNNTTILEDCGPCPVLASYTLAFNTKFLYSITIYILHYNPRHFSSRTNSSSGVHILLLQHLVSSLSVNGCIVHRLRADSVLSQAVYCTAVHGGVSPTAIMYRYDTLCHFDTVP